VFARNTRRVVRRRGFCTIEEEVARRRPLTQRLWVAFEHKSGWAWVHTRTKVKILQVFSAMGTLGFLLWKNPGMNLEPEPEPEPEAVFSFEENAKLPGVTVHPSGLQIQFLSCGDSDGTKVSRKTPHVRIDVRGSLTDLRTLCVTTQMKPAMCFKYTNVFHGLKLGLEMLREGDQVIFYIPAHLGYRNYGFIRSFPVTTPVICMVEVLEVSEKPLKPKKRYGSGFKNTVVPSDWGGFGFG